MNHPRLKMIIASLAVVAAVTVLAVTGAREGWVYSLPVDQFVDNPEYASQRVRISGVVGESDLIINTVTMTAIFNLHGESQHIRVEYHGIIPDMFKAGHNVIVEGRMNEVGLFQADTLMTKCASKYESDIESPPHLDPQAAGT